MPGFIAAMRLPLGLPITSKSSHDQLSGVRTKIFSPEIHRYAPSRRVPTWTRVKFARLINIQGSSLQIHEACSIFFVSIFVV